MNHLFVFAAFLVEQAKDGLGQSIDALTEAMGTGNLILAIVAAVCIAAVAVLKFMGKNIPFVDQGIEIVLAVARKLKKPADPAKSPGVSNVIDIKKDGPSGPTP